MHRLLLLFIACCLIGAAPAAHSADWPRFLGPRGTALSPETGLNKDWKARPPREVWRAALTDKGFAGLCVADGKLFVTDHQGKQDVVRALDKATGAERWHFAYDDAPNASFGFARSTPAFDAGRLYTFSRTGKLHCLGAADGKPLWSADCVKDLGGQRPRFGYTASPVVAGGALIVVPGGHGNIVALDKLTGKLMWRGGNDEVPGYVTPVVATLGGREQILYSSGFNLLAVDAKDGKLLWAWSWPTYNGNNIAQPVVRGTQVYFTSSDAYGGTMLDLAGGRPKELWSSPAIQSQFNAPVLCGGYIYGTTDPEPGALVCLDPATGKAAWRQDGFEKGPLMMVDGVLLALDGKSGVLAMIAPTPQGYKELGRITPLGGKSWTPLAVSDGKLYTRNEKTLVCLELK
jgi:outer membrane protein assembly factor BamB